MADSTSEGETDADVVHVDRDDIPPGQFGYSKLVD